MLTVYFDTSFYIDLGEAPEPEAAEVIAALNRLEVRHVLSPVVFTELARVADRADLHLRMLERLAEFALAPLNLNPDDNWLALAPGEHRERLAAREREIDAATVYLRAVATGGEASEQSVAVLGCLLGDEAPATLTQLDGSLARARLASSLREAEHMAVFASFADAIDRLCVDGSSHARLGQRSDHFLHQLGLAQRCFAAPGLAELPELLAGFASR